MEYLNAREVLPARLIAELQQYASGKLVYIPIKDCDRTGWGQRSGTRRELDRRNRQIRAQFRQGVDIDTLASQFFLSPETIKKIVYTRK
ncbi:MAG: CD3324 family protein [Bacillota bacterium]